MEVHIASSKTDQYRMGDKVLVARTGNGTCPVQMMERYFERAQIDKKSKQNLFRGIFQLRMVNTSEPQSPLVTLV